MKLKKGRRKKVVASTPEAAPDYSMEIPGDSGAWYELGYIAPQAAVIGGKVSGIRCRFCGVPVSPIWGQHPASGAFYVRGRILTQGDKQTFALPNVCDKCGLKAIA